MWLSHPVPSSNHSRLRTYRRCRPRQKDAHIVQLSNLDKQDFEKTMTASKSVNSLLSDQDDVSFPVPVSLTNKILQNECLAANNFTVSGGRCSGCLKTYRAAGEKLRFNFPVSLAEIQNRIALTPNPHQDMIYSDQPTVPRHLHAEDAPNENAAGGRCSPCKDDVSSTLSVAITRKLGRK